MKRTIIFLTVIFFLSIITDAQAKKSQLQHKEAESYTLGNFVAVYPTENNTLKIMNVSNPQKILWESSSGGFISAAVARDKITEARGSVRLDEKILKRLKSTGDEEAAYDGNALTINGHLKGGGIEAPYVFSLRPVSENRLGFEVKISDETCPCNRLIMHYASSPDEKFYGFGEQFSYLNLKGRKFPVVSQEQGIGRGAFPLTSIVNYVAPGSGGSWFSTYTAVPFYLTTKLRGLFLENHEITIFDLTKSDEVIIENWGPRFSGQIISGDTYYKLIEEFTAYAGRMQKLPGWMNKGAIIGMQGGTKIVLEKFEALKKSGTPMGGFWLQDWVGKRKTSFGSQLWWNWELDTTQYPDWERMRAALLAEKDLSGDGKGIRVLTYINPFLADVETKKDISGKALYKRNLFKEAALKGYLVKNSSGGPYMIKNTSFDAGLVDITNPEARIWLKGIIKDQVIGAGASGWMADFGEALPFDAKLFSGELAKSYHNSYPEEWARLNREVLSEVGLEGDTVFFSRSGATRSPLYSPLFWLGDQLVSFDGDDGMRSSLKGMLSGGISGYSLNHSDIGGYTTLGPLYKRSKELLLRWMEMNAFTPVYRTHEGNQPGNNVQFYSDDETMAHFTRFAKVFRALASYRETLMDEAQKTGKPLVRHLMLEFPDDSMATDIDSEFMLGPDFLIAPVMDEGISLKKVYLPEGFWVHLWTGKVYGSILAGGECFVEARIGEPPVFYKKGSDAGEKLALDIKK
jgi:sulfoquinovosidase